MSTEFHKEQASHYPIHTVSPNGKWTLEITYHPQSLGYELHYSWYPTDTKTPIYSDDKLNLYMNLADGMSHGYNPDWISDRPAILQFTPDDDLEISQQNNYPELTIDLSGEVPIRTVVE